ncbi:MAG: glycerophosphodiester phosphodiesterase [Elusimicrobia bacterium]|nr:glycerophosphodiester phosphodiesterase [Elusimicrobiota bacterium]
MMKPLAGLLLLIVASVTPAAATPTTAPLRGWFVHETPFELARSAAILERAKELNPGLEIIVHQAWEVLPMAPQALARRLSSERVSFVLSANPAIRRSFEALRGAGLSEGVDFGLATRREIMLEGRPGLPKLAGSRIEPKKYLFIGENSAAPRLAAGLSGSRLAWRQLADTALHCSWPGEDERIPRPWFDPRQHRDARKLAAFLEYKEIDVLIVEDPRALKLAWLMQTLGYHEALAVVPTGRAAAFNPWRSPVVAHYSGNSLKAAEAAARLQPVPTLDLDLRALPGGKEGEYRFIARHDENPAAGRAAPLVEDVLKLVASAGAEVQIELKDNAGEFPGVEGEVLALLRREGLLSQAWLSSFDLVTLGNLRALDPSARLGYLPSSLGKGWLSFIRGLLGRSARSMGRGLRESQAQSLHLLWTNVIFRPWLINYFQRRGFEVWIYTVNNRLLFWLMRRLGADRIFTDRPERFSRED